MFKIYLILQEEKNLTGFFWRESVEMNVRESNSKIFNLVNFNFKFRRFETDLLLYFLINFDEKYLISDLLSQNLDLLAHIQMSGWLFCWTLVEKLYSFYCNSSCTELDSYCFSVILSLIRLLLGQTFVEVILHIRTNQKVN